MYLCFDCETGGLTTDHSLLTAAFVLADANFRPMFGGTKRDTLTLAIRHPVYMITPEAVSINRLDLIHHSAVGVSPEDATAALASFLEAGKNAAGEKLIPIGHNMLFDLQFLWAQLMPKKQWSTYCHYHTLDTMSAAHLFKAAGVLTGGCGLGELCEIFGVELPAAHTALDDTRATLQLASCLVALASGIHRPLEEAVPAAVE